MIVFSKVKVIKTFNDDTKKRVNMPAIVPKNKSVCIMCLLSALTIEESSNCKGDSAKMNIESTRPSVVKDCTQFPDLSSKVNDGHKPINYVKRGIFCHAHVVSYK